MFATMAQGLKVEAIRQHQRSIVHTIYGKYLGFLETILRPLKQLEYQDPESGMF